MTIKKIKNRLGLANIKITTQQAQAIINQSPSLVEATITGIIN